MNTTIRGHNLRLTRMIALLAVLLLLAVALVLGLQPAPTTGDGDANHVMSAEGAGEASLTEDPYVERHADVVERLGNGRLR